MTKINWQKTISRKETPIRSELIGRGAAFGVSRLLGVPNDNFLFVLDKGNGSAYFDPLQIKAMGEKIVEKLNSDPSFLNNHAKDLINQCENLVEISQKISNQKLKNLSQENLKDSFEVFAKAHFSFSPYMMVPIAIEKVITQVVKEKLLENKLISKNSQKLDFYLGKLLIPEKLPETIKEQIDFSQLIQQFAKSKNHEELIRNHWLKYRWLSVYSPSDEPFSLGYFKKKVLEALKDKEKTVNKSVSAQFETTVRKLKLDSKTLALIKLLREYVYLRTFRVEQLCKAYFHIQPLFKEIARRANVLLYDLCLCNLDEIKNFLNGEKTLIRKDELKRRKKIYLYIIKKGLFKNYSGGNAKKIFEQEVEPTKIAKGIIELKGNVAYRGGVIRGKVRIIDKASVGNLQKGEVLVAIMTFPEFVPAIKKSVAIITDEGGVLCHAAIVSREMRKPCIIGTQIATKIFKNGDLIEVDTARGIVRKMPQI